MGSASTRPRGCVVTGTSYAIYAPPTAATAVNPLTFTENSTKKTLQGIQVLVLNFYKGCQKTFRTLAISWKNKKQFLSFQCNAILWWHKCVNGTEIPAARKTHASCRCLCLSDCIAASSTVPRCRDYRIYDRGNR
ncbi:hypothetical protein ALC56_00742 [Trachymyrmex septentrionalis]|uniref:Uncharacterized protein n=1 Tax=Trachymyrmex septentrionalis TaxID=34720 RepID=A0A195FWQ2_9HYME|nr:hypothetical protein ALC56_00742 [Trachymyrmex septentrionalis]